MELFEFDDDYVRRLREGDRDTAEHFHAYFRDLLLLKLRRRLTSMHAIDEVRQEVFVRCFERLGDLRDARRLGSFTNSICNRVLMEHYRLQGRTESFDPSVDIADDIDVEQRLESARIVARVRRVIETLPERDADILRSVFLEREDKDAICRRFDIDRDYLRVLLHRAKKVFRTQYLRRKSGRLSISETFGDRASLQTDKQSEKKAWTEPNPPPESPNDTPKPPDPERPSDTSSES